MATDVDDIVKQGYIRIRSRRLGIWQRRWIILRRASSKGPCRLEKYPDEKCARSGGSHKLALLTSVNTISRMPSSMRRHAFSICFHDGTSKCLSCDSDMDADTWVKLFVQECLLPQPGLATGEPDVLSPGIQKELQEQFHVYLIPTPKLDVFGECLLQVTHENIYLWDVTNPRLKLVAWPLTALRRYGSDPTKFTFEAGRHCCTGEGMFVFHTLEGEKIYRKVHQATLAIAEAHHRLQDQMSKLSLNRTQDSSGQMQPGLSLSQEITLQSGGHRSETIVTQELATPNGDSAGPSGIVEDSNRETDGEEPAQQSFRRLPQTGTSKCSLRSHLLQCNNVANS